MALERHTWTLALLVMLSATASGCSWALVRQAPAEYTPAEAERPPDCTTSLGPAIGDTWDAIAVGGGLVATGALTLADPFEEPILTDAPALGIAEMGIGAGLGTMFGLSARYGYSSARECRRLRDAFQSQLYRRIDAAATNRKRNSSD